MTSSGIELHNKTASLESGRLTAATSQHLNSHLFTFSTNSNTIPKYSQQTHKMAAATRKDLLKKVYNMVPPMLESFHKGKN
jgi:hypothetical protein